MNSPPPEPVDRTEVVTVFLQKRDTILLARRSDEVRTYPGRWAGISGYLESDDPLQQALIEIREETGLDPGGVELKKRGEPLEVDDPEQGLHWRVHPFRFRIDAGATVETDWEHETHRWVRPERIKQLPTVPDLEETWERVKP